ncbi:hypothetical protein [Argonema galeatum]|uniref:hypothetical protein n=1 Tax=Argonema galeatum TaxID=2942762 RepID=UPI002013219A|nr:hypothetical protein [Argonema galeatum]MCL1469010.1 hypothetical protein [Argonema galeatum A003/A1]
MSNLKLVGKRLKNLRLYQEAQQIGFDYILNPDTGELHLVGLDNFWGSHNLADADISSFIGLNDIGTIPVEVFRDGKILPVYDLDTGEIIGEYALNKCSYCFKK